MEITYVNQKRIYLLTFFQRPKLKVGFKFCLSWDTFRLKKMGKIQNLFFGLVL